mgnify:CR=1 FL=1
MKLVLMIGAALVFAGLLIWISLTARKLADNMSLLRNKIDEQKSALTNLAILTQESERAEEILVKLKLLLPNTDQLLFVSSELETFAKTSALDQSFSFGAESPASESQPKAIGVNIVLSGGIRNFVEYLRKIENVPYVLNLTEIEISGQGVKYQINAAGKIYIQ